MIWEDLKEELVLTGLDAESSGEVFERLGKTLIKEGYCKDSYIDALKAREKDFPTGVNMGGVGIAIPHTDKSHVYKGAVAIGVLKKPVKFIRWAPQMKLSWQGSSLCSLWTIQRNISYFYRKSFRCCKIQRH